MAKYIDADEIEIILDGAIQGEEVTGNAPMINAHELMCMLHDIPSADVTEVVRCKDCRFHEDEEIGMVYCPAVVGGWVEDNWFCKGGEREDE